MKRSVTTLELASSAESTFTATRLPMSTFSASYTAAMPPRPISLVTRNLPSRMVPIATTVGLSKSILGIVSAD
jgi:hypothetical protein